MATSSSRGLVANDHLADATCVWADFAARAGVFGIGAGDGGDDAIDARAYAAPWGGDLGLSANDLVATRVTRVAYIGGFVRGDGGVGDGDGGQRTSALSEPMEGRVRDPRKLEAVLCRALVMEVLGRRSRVRRR